MCNSNLVGERQLAISMILFFRIRALKIVTFRVWRAGIFFQRDIAHLHTRVYSKTIPVYCLVILQHVVMRVRRDRYLSRKIRLVFSPTSLAELFMQICLPGRLYVVDHLKWVRRIKFILKSRALKTSLAVDIYHI